MGTVAHDGRWPLGRPFSAYGGCVAADTAAAQSHGPCAELAHLLDRSIVTNLGGARGGGSPESKLLNLRGE